MCDDSEEGIVWDSSQPSTSAAIPEGEEDPFVSSIPSQEVEGFLCTSPSKIIPPLTASDVARNISSQNLLFGDIELDLDRNQLVLEDEEFLFDLPKDGSTSSVQLADALIDRITADDPMMTSAESSSNLNQSGLYPQSTNETRERYPNQTPGVYDLKVSVEATSKRKASDYVYQADEKALFARPFVYIPFIVHLSKAPSAGAMLRVYACYSRGEHAAIPVTRCPHHLSADQSSIREHFILLNSSSAVYVNAVGANDRSYVCVPIPESCDPIFVPLQFTCFSSCNGGISRRPLHVCFELEMKYVYFFSGQLVDHYELSLKVCACPARDAILEGFEPPRRFNYFVFLLSPQKKRRTVVTKPVTEVVTKSHCVSSEKKSSFKEDEDTVYEVQVRGRHLYKLVCSIIASYELSRRYLREKADEGKLDTLKSPHTPLSHRTAIPTWLANLELSKYEDLFSAKSLFVIDDLEGVINKKFLCSLGVSEEDSCKMLESYLSWFDVYNAQRQSSLSSHGSSIRIQRTRVRSSTVRLSS
ncbi:unnamed protein product [Toxocara canis]|uniref:Cellular tumor antigen p53 n=1 Tax=Toxocara canis TaxID=6265 RepID=A0A183V270_TOXCA|nr:unnamed protein product [Toxocara canis]